MRKRRQDKLLSTVFAFILVFSGSKGFAVSSTHTEDFTSVLKNDLNKTTGVWNVSSGTLHPTLEVTGWSPGAGTASLDVGNGSHGVFDSTTYANFSDGGDVSGNIIRLNTSTYKELQVTSFTLETGWTLQPTGSNPLIIRSQSFVVIQGTVDCSGEAGTGLNLDYTTVNSGGAGRCGGGSGGTGAYFGTTGQNGSNGGTGVTGGTAGGTTVGVAGGNGGGGGGAYSQAGTSATAGSTPSGGGGSGAGNNNQDDAFTTIAGGSGGGGGGLYDQADANQSSGGGGGGGGGIVIIHSVGNIVISATGTITTNGGSGGGASAGGGMAGSGGGGGGGGVQLMSGGNVTLVGPVTALEGAGGTSDGGNGGNGGRGRTWIAALISVTGNTDNPISQLVGTGNVRYVTTAVNFYSNTIDINNTLPKYETATLTSSLTGGSTATVQLAGSTDGVSFTNFATSSDFGQLNYNRYFKYQITLTNTDTTSPAYISALNIGYDGHQQDDFSFTAAGCGTTSTTKTPPASGLPFLLVLILWIFLRLRIKTFRYH